VTHVWVAADGIGLVAVEFGTALREYEIGRNSGLGVGRAVDPSPPTTLTAGTESDRGSRTLAVDHSDLTEGIGRTRDRPTYMAGDPLKTYTAAPSG